MVTDKFFSELEKNLNPPSNGFRTSPGSREVIKRTLMLKIDIKTYPNGAMYIDQSSSKMWFNNQGEVVKKKVKKKLGDYKKEKGMVEL